MPDVWGALGQAIPAAAALTPVYTVPSGKQTTMEVVICNRGAATTVRLSHAIAGAADAPGQYLLYDFSIPANDAIVTARTTVKATDTLRVSSASGQVSFNVNGIEEDA